ncbi:MAG: FliG C-terminal domain-containing protein [Polyangiaceae bacterium]
MLTGPEKAVIFLLSLDERVAAPIVAELSDAELRKLRSVASTMSEVQSDGLDEAYIDFLDRSSKCTAVPRGGLRYLRRIAANALGEDRARGVFEDGVTSPLARLEAAPPDAVAALLEREPPQLAAAVLARLEPATAALILGAMPPDRQSAVVARVTRLTELPASALEEVASVLVAELPDNEGATIGVDGMARAAGILNAANREVTDGVLGKLAPEVARKLKLAMFTFFDLARLDSKAMRVLLKEVPSERLTTALKNAPPDVMRAVLSGLSSRAADVLRDDLELIGNLKKSDIEGARDEILEIALRLEAEAGLDLGRNVE